MASTNLTEDLDQHEEHEANTLWRGIGYTAPIDSHHEESCANYLRYKDE